ANSTARSTSTLIWLTRDPTSRFDGPGAAFNQRSLIWVRMPFLRAIQRSRKIFQSLSPETAWPSWRTAANSSWTALSRLEAEKSSSLGTVYIDQPNQQRHFTTEDTEAHRGT